MYVQFLHRCVQNIVLLNLINRLKNGSSHQFYRTEKQLPTITRHRTQNMFPMKSVIVQPATYTTVCQYIIGLGVVLSAEDIYRSTYQNNIGLTATLFAGVRYLRTTLIWIQYCLLKIGTTVSLTNIGLGNMLIIVTVKSILFTISNFEDSLTLELLLYVHITFALRLRLNP